MQLAPAGGGARSLGGGGVAAPPPLPLPLPIALMYHASAYLGGQARQTRALKASLSAA